MKDESKATDVTSGFGALVKVACSVDSPNSSACLASKCSVLQYFGRHDMLQVLVSTTSSGTTHTQA